MSDDIRKRALDLYRPPFNYHPQLGWIFDGEGKQVLDKIDETAVLRIRGWGRIGYLENPEKLQDMVGELIAEALNEFWKENHGSITEVDRMKYFSASEDREYANKSICLKDDSDYMSLFTISIVESGNVLIDSDTEGHYLHLHISRKEAIEALKEAIAWIESEE